MKILSCLIALLAWLQFASAADAPIVQADTEIRYWRAIVQAERATAAAKEAQAEVQAIAQEVTTQCGEDHKPQDQVIAGKPTGRLICAVKESPKQ